MTDQPDYLSAFLELRKARDHLTNAVTTLSTQHDSSERLVHWQTIMDGEARLLLAEVLAQAQRLNRMVGASTGVDGAP